MLAARSAAGTRAGCRRPAPGGGPAPKRTKHTHQHCTQHIRGKPNANTVTHIHRTTHAHNDACNVPAWALTWLVTLANLAQRHVRSAERARGGTAGVRVRTVSTKLGVSTNTHTHTHTHTHRPHLYTHTAPGRRDACTHDRKRRCRRSDAVRLSSDAVAYSDAVGAGPR